LLLPHNKRYSRNDTQHNQYQTYERMDFYSPYAFMTQPHLLTPLSNALNCSHYIV